MRTTARSQIGSYEAKTHLPRLLDEVEAGASYTITKHGRPVARLVPIRGGKRAPEEVLKSFEELRAIMPRDLGAPIKELIEEGRR